jgi:hypothetical protein
MSLIDRILDEAASIDVLDDYLDGLPAEERLAQTRALDREAQRRLYVKASGAAPLDLQHFVPAGRGELQPVRHRGRNTLPLPGRHKLFSKMFCRPDDGTPRLFGYNDAPSRLLIGPGYFVAVMTVGHPRWSERGGVLIDYFQVPDGRVCSAWPRVVANRQGLQRYVYDGTRDYMRRVSAHVSVGAAFRGEQALDHYFVLCREDG